jgi:hypothetical protein
MDLILLRADERTFIDVGVYFNVGVVAQLESVLVVSALSFSLVAWRGRRKH